VEGIGGVIRIAPLGHCAAHAPHPMHRAKFTLATRSTKMAPTGHTPSQLPHPTHLSISTEALRSDDLISGPAALIRPSRKRSRASMARIRSLKTRISRSWSWPRTGRN